MNIFEGGNIIFICNNWAKYTKDPYILDLEFNDLQLDLKKALLQQGGDSHLPSAKKTNISLEIQNLLTNQMKKKRRKRKKTKSHCW